MGLTNAQVLGGDDARADPAPGAVADDTKLHLHVLAVDRARFKQIRTNDLMAHFGGSGCTYIEWLGDTSCNAHYDDASVASIEANQAKLLSETGKEAEARALFDQALHAITTCAQQAESGAGQEPEKDAVNHLFLCAAGAVADLTCDSDGRIDAFVGALGEELGGGADAERGA